METPANLIASIEPFACTPPPKTGAEYAGWVVTVLATAEAALYESGLSEVHMISLDIDDIVLFNRDEAQLVGQALVIAGATGQNRCEGTALVHYTANGQIRISVRA